MNKLTVVAILPFLSGAAALSHELLWSRRLIDLLGATDWVTGRVLGLFFFGISVGGFLAAKWQSKRRSAMFQLAVAEFIVCLFALPAAFLPAWSDWIWPFVGAEFLVSWQGAILKLLLAGMVILPPAIAMGFTLPYFVRSATELGGNVASIGIWTYAINTLGGVFGLWLTSSYLIGWLGAQKAMLFTAATNLLIALIAFWFAKKTGNRQQELTGNNLTAKVNLLQSQPFLSRSQVVALSFLSGFVVLSLEVLLLRLIALVVPSSFHTTSALLANVILILAVSSIAISLLNQFVVARPWLVFAGLLGCALFGCFCPLILYHQTDQLISLRFLQGLAGREIESINHYWLLVFWLVASVGGIALFWSGLVFPTLFSISSLDDPKGTRIGTLLAINGIGGLVGSEVANSVLTSYFGVYVSFFVLAAFIGFVVCCVLGNLNWKMGVAAALPLSLVIFFGLTATNRLPYLSPRATTKFQVEETRFGRDGVFLVVEDQIGSKSILMNNQYVLGSSGVAEDERRQLRLPWLLKPDAKSVCSLGLATGISAGGLESLPNAPSILAVELSETVAQIAERHFDAETNKFFKRSENRVVIEDARTFIASSDDKFDLIVADLFRPHGAGEGRLFSLEHFQNVRRALKKNGLFCQWLPMHQLNLENFEVIAATFQRVFPETLVIWGTVDLGTPVLGLIARENDIPWQKEEFAEAQKLASESFIDDENLGMISSLVVGVLEKNAFEDVASNTLDNMSVEISAGNFWILKDLTKDQPKPGFENSLIRQSLLTKFDRYLRSRTNPLFPTDSRRQYFQMLQKRMRK